MAQIRGAEFVVQPLRSSGGSLLASEFMRAGVLFLLATSWMHAQSASTSSPTPNNTPTVSAVSLVSAQAPLGFGQVPIQPPTVAWDGTQLTIDAENSSLGDILMAVREKTGASIEIPGAASGERVFVHLGPGPVRDVISSLVYGMPFDYVVETAEDNPDTLRRVVLTARGESDGSSNVFVAGGTDTGEGSPFGIPGQVAAHRGGGDGRAKPGQRMMPGWAGPSMPAFQVDAENLAAQQAAVQDSAGLPDSTTPDPAGQEAAASKDAPVAAEAVESARASNASPPTADSNDQSGVGQAIQSMKKMFELRRQIQAQQNQPPSQSSN